MLSPLVMQTAPLNIDKKSQPVGGGAAIMQRFNQTGSHCSYDFADTTCRFKQSNIAAWTGLPGDTLLKGVYLITLHPDAAGDTFFLPYGVNEIHSVKLPARPDLGRTGIRTVITANLSGCCIFVEKKGLTNDVIFYHANAARHSPDQRTGSTVPKFQSGAALDELARLHRAASAQYPGQTIAFKSLVKTEYLDEVETMLIRERAVKENRKKDLAYGAGTFVAAFFRPGTGWEFWYQTWARTEQYFDNIMSKKATDAAKKYGSYQVVDCGPFFP
jgi:hypothetical protein